MWFLLVTQILFYISRKISSSSREGNTWKLEGNKEEKNKLTLISNLLCYTSSLYIICVFTAKRSHHFSWCKVRQKPRLLLLWPVQKKWSPHRHKKKNTAWKHLAWETAKEILALTEPHSYLFLWFACVMARNFCSWNYKPPVKWKCGNRHLSNSDYTPNFGSIM